ncbi:acyl-CoA N-acyltransferase [Cerioporus squamosus]|nr:acyl-CoA N-acyltransferase [Cerioporus squamosus]
MSPPPELRFVRFDDPHAFLEATKQFDDSFMNFCIGSLYDYVGSPQYAAVNASQPAHLFAIYRGDQLLLTITGFLRISVTHNAADAFAWILCIPTTAEALVMGTPSTPGLLAPAIALLAPSILSALSANPLVLDKLIGPEPAVNAFMNAWSALLAERGLRVRIRPGEFGSRVSYVTRASLPPPPSPPFPYPVIQATAADLEPLAQLYIAFQLDTPWHGVVSREAALAFIERPVKAGLVWYIRVDGEPVGYVLLGRITPRTISIRNVFVSAAHRRKGLAEAMVRGVARYYLNAPPHGVQPIQDGPPAVGFKEEMNLNVAEAGAERVYKRCGFLFPDNYGDNATGGIDPATGRKAWYPSAGPGVVREPEPSSEEQGQ